jgi:hypothetical protein
VVLVNSLTRFGKEFASGTDGNAAHTTGSYINSNQRALLIAFHERIRP